MTALLAPLATTFFIGVIALCAVAVLQTAKEMRP